MCSDQLTKKELETDNLYALWDDRANLYENMSKGDIALSIKATGDNEAGGEEFLSPELAIASAAGTAVAVVGDEAQKRILDIIETQGVDALETAIETARPIMEEAFAYSTTEKKVKDAIDRAIKTGSTSAGLLRSSLDNIVTRDDVLNGMVSSTKYYTNSYFNKEVAPRLFAVVDDVLAAGGDVNVEAYNAIQRVLDQRLKSVPYWRVVANSAASRSYHFGIIKAGMLSGRRAYIYTIVDDDRTSDICKAMAGREFWLPDAEDLVVRAATATEEDIKLVSPWLRKEDIIGKSNRELVDQGTFVPPLHGSCRSTVTLI